MLSGHPLKTGSKLSAKERHRQRRESFDSIAEVYERVRPSYPEELFDDLVALARLAPSSRILEIGPGTGQASLPLARRGFRLYAVELSPRMARVWRQRLRSFPGSSIVVADFDHWQPESGEFDMVLAASSFHWLSRRTAFRHCAALLKPAGSIALVWHFRLTPKTPLQRDIDTAYQQLGLRKWHARPPEQRIQRQKELLLNSGLFRPVTVKRYPVSVDYSASEYIDLLSTMSDHAILPPAVRQRLFGKVREAIENHGGILRRDYITTLFWAPCRHSA